jgi:CheY-like chemotaxis protein
MSGRVLVVGLERPLYLKIEPILGRSALSADRVQKGESGLALTDHAVFDLLVVRHPLPDMSLGTFINRVHDPGAPCGAAPILVLTEDSQIESVRALLPGGGREVMSIKEPARLLQEIASRLLGVTPRVASRVLVRLRVDLGQGPQLVSCQSENLSETGMLLRAEDLFPLGTRVQFEFTLPGERVPVQGDAEVVRHTVADVESVLGMGLKVLAFKGDGARTMRRFVTNRSAS